MSTLREAAQQALEALKSVQDHRPNDETNAAVTALRAALAQEPEPRWLTKALMADYIDMIAEAIENDSSETLRHKAHWMRRDGEA